MSEQEQKVGLHEYDDDACCIHCGFDGAEWHWWKNSTYEGRAQPEARRPLCLVNGLPRISDGAQSGTRS